MPIARVELPDGRIGRFEVPEGLEPDEIEQLALAEYDRLQTLNKPAPSVLAEEKKSGIIDELVRGGKQLYSTARTGIETLFGSPEEAARAGIARGEEIDREAGEGPSLEAIKRAYEERGLLPAAGEAVSQIPRALAGQGANIGTAVAGARLGAMAGSPFGPVGSVVGGVAGSAIGLAPSVFGTQTERQAEEQIKAGKPVDIDVGAAALGTAASVALESAGLGLTLGKRVVKGILGIADDAALASTRAADDLVKAAGRTLAGGVVRGAAVEMPVEVAQSVIERAQAGLDLTSPDALKEYGEAAYLAGLVGGPLGGVGRYVDRSGARNQLARQAEEERQQAAQEAFRLQQEQELVQQQEQAQQALMQEQQRRMARLPVGGQGMLFRGAEIPKVSPPPPAAPLAPQAPNIADVRTELFDLKDQRDRVQAYQDQAREAGDVVGVEEAQKVINGLNRNIRPLQRQYDVLVQATDQAAQQAFDFTPPPPTSAYQTQGELDFGGTGGPAAPTLRTRRVKGQLNLFDQPAAPATPAAPAAPAWTPASFAKELSEGRKLDTPEAIQYYQNNAEEVEIELRKLRETAAPTPATAQPGAITLASVGAINPSLIPWFKKNIEGKTVDDVRAMVEADPKLAEGRSAKAQLVRTLLVPETPPYQEPQNAGVRSDDGTEPATERGAGERGVAVDIEDRGPLGSGEPPVVAGTPAEATPGGLDDVEQPTGVGVAPEKTTATAVVREPIVTKSEPPTEPNVPYAPTLNLDYGDYDIENSGPNIQYTFKQPKNLTTPGNPNPVATAQSMFLGFSDKDGDGVTLNLTNPKGIPVRVRVRPDYIELESDRTGGYARREANTEPSTPLNNLFGKDFMAQLDALPAQERVPFVIKHLLTQFDVADPSRFLKEFDTAFFAPEEGTSNAPKATETVQAEAEGREPEQAPTEKPAVKKTSKAKLTKAKNAWNDYGPEDVKFTDLDEEGQAAWVKVVEGGKPTISDADNIASVYKKKPTPKAEEVEVEETEAEAEEPEAKPARKPRAAKKAKAEEPKAEEAEVEVEEEPEAEVEEEPKAEEAKVEEEDESLWDEAKKAAKYPDGPFTGADSNVVAGKSVDPKLADYIRALTKKLGLGNVRILMVSDAKDLNDPGLHLHGVFGSIVKPLKAEIRKGNTLGLKGSLGTKDFVIYVNKELTEAQAVEAVAHELGHVIQDVAFNSAPQAMQDAILLEYDAWFNKTIGLNTVDLVRSVYTPSTSDYVTADKAEGHNSPKFNLYARKFNEWFANNVARWAITDKKPVSIVEKFFKSVADSLKKMVKILSADRYMPAQSVADFLNKMGPDKDPKPKRGVMPTISIEQLITPGPNTNTPGFKRWFSGSKVVDEGGKPKVMYHGTAQDIKAFRAKQVGAIFVTSNPRFAEDFSLMSETWMASHYRDILSKEQIKTAKAEAKKALAKDYKGVQLLVFRSQIDRDKPTGAAHNAFQEALKNQLPSRANIIPVYVSANNPFDYDNPQHLRQIAEYFGDSTGRTEKVLSNGDWDYIEQDNVQKAIRDLGFDGFYIREGGEKNLAVYEPTQIKSVFNPGTFDPNNPDIEALYTPDNITTSSELYQPRPNAITRAVRSVAGEAAASEGENAVTRFRTINVDASASVAKKISAAFDGKLRDATGNINPLPQLRQANDYGKLMVSLFEQGSLIKNRDNGLYQAGRVEGVPSAKDAFDVLSRWAKANGVSFTDAKNELSKMLEARRLDYFRRNPQLGIPIHKLSNRDPRSANAQIDTMLAKFNSQPQLREVADMLQKMRVRLVNQMYEVGRISEADRDLWTEAVEYIPFDRMEEFGSKFRSSRRTGRGLSSLGNLPEIIGSERRETQNVLDNQIKNFGWMMGQILNNDAAVATARTLERIGAAQYRGGNGNIAPEHRVKVYMNGEDRYFEMQSRWDVKAFTALNLPKSWAVQQMGNFSNMLRTTVTALPPFSLKQVTDDIQRAFVLSGVKNPYALIFPILRNFLAVAWYEITGRRHPYVRQMGQKGVTGEYDFDYRDPSTALLQDFGYIKRPWFKELVHRMEGITRASDLAVRKAIYDQFMKETGDEHLASTRAREFINFRRRGSGQLIATATATIPFFNAYVQSMDLLYRNATGTDVQLGEGRGVAKRMFIAQLVKMSALAAVYALAVGDDDEYEGMNLRTRNNNWIIPGMGKLPVPNELAAITKVPVEMTLEYLRRKGTKEELEAADATMTVLKYAFEQFGGRVVPIPTAVRPVLEAFTNFSFLGGRPLEGIYQRTLDPEMRVTPTTSELAKTLAKASKELIGVAPSPINVDNFLNQWFGTTAATVTMMADGVLNPDKMDRPLHKYFLLSTYMYDPVPGQGVNEAYELREKFGTKHNTLLKLAQENPDEALKYAEANQKELVYAKFANGLMEEFEKTRKYKAFLQSSQAAKVMTQEERAEQMKGVREIENTIGLQVRELKTFVNKDPTLK